MLADFTAQNKQCSHQLLEGSRPFNEEGLLWSLQSRSFDVFGWSSLPETADLSPDNPAAEQATNGSKFLGSSFRSHGTR
jgi:hypothetical protein